MSRFVSVFVWLGVLCLGMLPLVHCSEPGEVADGGEAVVEQSAIETRPIRESGPPVATGVSFPATTAPSCPCKSGEKYATPHNPALSAEAGAVANSPDGIYLAVASKLQVVLYKRDKPGDLYNTSAQTLTMPQTVGQVVFSPDSKRLLVIIDQQVQLWDVEKVIADPKTGVIWTHDAPAETIIADGVFVGDTLIALGFYGKKENDPVQVWSVGDSQESAKMLVTLEAPAVQSLAVSASGQFLVVGGRTVTSDPSASVAMFTVFGWEQNGTEVKVKNKQAFLTPFQKTNITTLSISSDNAFLAIGTSPDLDFQRGAPKRAPEGDHGNVSIWPTKPLQLNGGVLLLEPQKTRAHSLSVSRVAFRADGEILATLGVGSPRNAPKLHLWKRQSDKPKQPFAHVDTLEPTTPGRGLTFGVACQYLYTTSIQTPSLQMWKGCL